MSTINELPSGERLNNVKETLFGARDLIVRADSIVDGDHYAIVGGSVLTAAFALVWYTDPNFLTFISLIGFVLTILDYAGPKVLAYMFNTNDWDEAKEKKYHSACEGIAMVANKLENAWVSYNGYRNQKPGLQFTINVFALLLLAWIGNRINNFFLAYLFTISLVLLPKLLRQGALQKGMSTLKPLFEKFAVIISAQIETLTKKIMDFAKEKLPFAKEQYTMLKTE